MSVFINLSPWTHQLKNKTKRNIFSENMKTNCLIVGAGISGVTSAYFILKNTNLKVVLVEAKKLASGATGHNAGQMVSYFERQIYNLVKEYGLEQAISAQNDVNSSWVLIEEILYETKIDVAANFFTGYVGIQNFEDLLIHLENSKIYHEAGIPFEKLSILENSDFLDKTPKKYEKFYSVVSKENLLNSLETIDTSYKAIVSARKGVMNSALFCEELLNYMMVNFSNRISFFEDSPVKEIIFKNNLARSEINGKYLVSQKIVLCTNGFENIKISNHEGEDIDTKFHQMVRGSIGFMAGFLEEKILDPTALSYLPKSSKTGNDAYDSDPYFYLTRRNYDIKEKTYSLICVGGPEALLDDTNNYHKEHPYPKEAFKNIDEFIHKTYKYSPKGKIDYKYLWHGLMGYTPNGVRLIGPEPLNNNLLYNLGCNGIGILPSIYGSFKISKILNGEKFPKSLFDPIQK